jgi:hypothetical protein
MAHTTDYTTHTYRTDGKLNKMWWRKRKNPKGKTRENENMR